MIELIVLEHLEQELEQVPVYAEVPSDPPVEFVLIEKTGSSIENKIASSTIAVQSYSGSMYGAALLNEKVKDAMDSIVEKDDIASCRLQSDYNYTDTRTKHYRYQAVYDVTHY